MELEKWNPNFTVGEHFASCIIASRNSGKSYLMRHLIKDELIDNFDLFIVFCNSRTEQVKYEEVLPASTKYFYKFSETVIRKLYATNKKLEGQGKRIIHICVIMDDIIGKGVKNQDSILQVFANGRHHGISCIFLGQGLVLASPEWRSNSDYFIVLKQNVNRAREKIRDELLLGSLEVPDGVKEKAFYNTIMRKYINKQGDALVLDCSGESFDNLYWYRAP